MFIPLESTPPDQSGVIAMAGDERRRLRHDYLGTEHILLALVSDRASDLATVLSDAGIKRSGVVTHIREMVPDGSRTSVGRVSVTPMTRAVIEGANSIAALFSDRQVEPKHYLLSILAQEDSVAVEIIDRLPVDRGAIVDLVFARLMPAKNSGEFEPAPLEVEHLTSEELRNHLQSNELLRLTLDRYFARRRDDPDLAGAIGEKIAELERKRMRRLQMLRMMQRDAARSKQDAERDRLLPSGETTDASRVDQNDFRSELPDGENDSEDRRSAQD